MAKKYMKRYSMSLTWKRQIKTTVRYKLTPVRMSIITKISVGKDVERREPLGSVKCKWDIVYSGDVNWYSPHEKQCGGSSKNKNWDHTVVSQSHPWVHSQRQRNQGRRQVAALLCSQQCESPWTR